MAITGCLSGKRIYSYASKLAPQLVRSIASLQICMSRHLPGQTWLTGQVGLVQAACSQLTPMIPGFGKGLRQCFNSASEMHCAQLGA